MAIATSGDRHMQMPDAPSDDQVAAEVAKWRAAGGKVQRLKVGKSCRRPLSVEALNNGGGLIEVATRSPKREPPR